MWYDYDTGITFYKFDQRWKLRDSNNEKLYLGFGNPIRPVHHF